MKLRKQIIREFTTDEFKYLTLKELRNKMGVYYQEHISTKTIINKDTNKKIQFNRRKSRNKTLHKITFETAAVIKNLLQLLREAVLISVEAPIGNHPDVYRVFAFLITCKIDGELMNFRVIVLEKEDGNFHYDLYDNEQAKGNL